MPRPRPTTAAGSSSCGAIRVGSRSGGRMAFCRSWPRHCRWSIGTMSKRTPSRRNGVTPIPCASARRSPASSASTAGATCPRCDANARSSNGCRRWNATSGSRSLCCAPATTTVSATAACSPISSRRAPARSLDADGHSTPDPLVPVALVHSARAGHPSRTVHPPWTLAARPGREAGGGSRTRPRGVARGAGCIAPRG